LHVVLVGLRRGRAEPFRVPLVLIIVLLEFCFIVFVFIVTVALALCGLRNLNQALEKTEKMMSKTLLGFRWTAASDAGLRST
jgi:hypothetical protein